MTQKRANLIVIRALTITCSARCKLILYSINALYDDSAFENSKITVHYKLITKSNDTKGCKKPMPYFMQIFLCSRFIELSRNRYFLLTCQRLNNSFYPEQEP
jgi:hypothetical protein